MKSKSSVVNLTCTAMLAAMVIILSLTPLGYIPVGPLKLTLLTLPVAIGGAVLGPWAGLTLGAVFGLTSFCTCFGMDALGTALFGINPVLTFLMCVVPRVLCGVLPPLLCKALPPRENALWKQILCCGLTAAVNTVLFLGAMWLFFGRELAGNAEIIAILDEKAVTTFWAVLVGFAGVNALIEIALNLTVGAAVSRAVTAALRRLH